jgi:hypothetical protein
MSILEKHEKKIKEIEGKKEKLKNYKEEIDLLKLSNSCSFAKTTLKFGFSLQQSIISCGNGKILSLILLPI